MALKKSAAWRVRQRARPAPSASLRDLPSVPKAGEGLPPLRVSAVPHRIFAKGPFHNPLSRRQIALYPPHDVPAQECHAAARNHPPTAALVGASTLRVGVCFMRTRTCALLNPRGSRPAAPNVAASASGRVPKPNFGFASAVLDGPSGALQLRTPTLSRMAYAFAPPGAPVDGYDAAAIRRAGRISTQIRLAPRSSFPPVRHWADRLLSGTCPPSVLSPRRANGRR